MTSFVPKLLCFITLSVALLPKETKAQFENPFQLEGGKRNFNTWQDKAPKEAAIAIGKRLVASVKFEHILTLPRPEEKFDTPRILDFGRSFWIEKQAIVFATSDITVNEDTLTELGIEHPDEAIVVVNNREIYRAAAGATTGVKVDLKKGPNRVLIKAVVNDKAATLTLDPKAARNLSVKISQFAGVDRSVSSSANWLIAGPFAIQNSGINTVCGPETGFIPGGVWEGLHGPVAWTLPRVEPRMHLANANAAASAGYAPAALAWTMGEFGSLTGNTDFTAYRNRYCEHLLGARKWVDYQVNTLHQSKSAHYQLLESNLAGRAAALLPFSDFLRENQAFDKKEDVVNWLSSGLTFMQKDQCRQPDGSFCREKPAEGYLLATDDLFMAIPFLLETAKIAGTGEKGDYLTMAATQAVLLHTATFDKKDMLYHQAKDVKEPSVYPYLSRSNGLALFAISLLLEALPKNHSDYKTILKNYQAAAEKLASLQNPRTGQWPRILNDTASATETSGNGLITASLARGINNGWLPRAKFAKTAGLGWKGICAYISKEGDVFGICLPMSLTEDAAYFKKLPQVRNSSEGLFPVLWAAMEVEKMRTKR